MTRVKKSLPILKICLDTNALFSPLAHQLVRSEISDAIKDSARHKDIKISWHIPNIVIDERRHQMNKKANEFLPQLAKLETLLGHNLNIDNKILGFHVGKAIETQILDLGIDTLNIDLKKVDWQKVVTLSVDRNPPFEDNEKEKGFRDLLIAETFFQLVNSSPSTPSICKLVFVTADKRLSEFVSSTISAKKNVRVLNDINETNELINTLTSTVPEEYLEEVKPLAQKLFFDKGDKNSIYYSEKITEKIKQKFTVELNEIPMGSDVREVEKWLIGSPNFIKKEKQRLFWRTLITIESNAYKEEQRGLSINEALGISLPTPKTMSLRDLLMTNSRTQTAKGITLIEILWSINVSIMKRMTRLTVDDIRFVSTVWEQV